MPSMRHSQILTIARFTLLEALRTRLLLHFVIVLALIVGTAYFIQQLAITETLRMQIAMSAAVSRIAAVFVLSLHVLTSIVRELNDKGLELTLSFDLKRADYILGRLLGFLAIAAMLALMAALPQLLVAPPLASMQWGISLALELAIMAAVSLFCIVTFTQLMPAASFVFGFYLLARALTAMRLMSDTPIVGGGSLAYRATSVMLDMLALVLPSLDRYAQSTWLVETTVAIPALGFGALHALLYVSVLTGAAMFDFYRRNL
jgi:hypothetical protein